MRRLGPALLVAAALTALALLVLHVLETPEAVTEKPVAPEASRAATAPAASPTAEGGLPRPIAAAETALHSGHVGADGAESGAVTWAGRTLRGRVTIADGGALPADLALVASGRRPRPDVRGLRELMGEGGESGGLVELQPLTPPQTGSAEPANADAWRPGPERLLRLATAEVGADGRFEMHDLPVGGAWIATEAEHLYVHPALRVGRDDDEVDVPLVRGASVRGRVLDVSGAPVAGAEIEGASRFDPWMVFDAGASMVKTARVPTDAQGAFTLPRIPAGVPLTLRVAAAHRSELRPEHVDLPPLQPGERRQLDLVLRTGGTISGRVLDADDAPVRQAKVAVRRTDLSLANMNTLADGETLQTADHTDAEGRFRVQGLPDGSYEVRLAEPGYRPVSSGSRALASGADLADIVLRADAGLSIEGRVVDGAGAPIAHAVVQAFRPPSFTDMAAALDRESRPELPVQPDGSFRLSGYDEGSVQLRASARGYRMARQDVQAGTAGLLVVLEPTVALSGIVVSLGDGEPVPTFTVSLAPAGGLFSLADPFGMEERFESVQPRVAFRDRDEGDFTIGDLGPGAWDLTVMAEGFGVTTLPGLEVGAEGRRGLVVMLPPEASVSGHVVAARSGLPVEGAQVGPGGGSLVETMSAGLTGTTQGATSDAQGRFRLGGLGGGELRLRVQHRAFRELVLEPLVLAPGEQRDLGVLRLPAGSVIFGRVLDGLGRPAPDVMVMASDALGTSLKRARTDAEGRYRIEGLAPNTYNVMRMDFTMNFGSDSGPMDFMKDMVFTTVKLGEDEEREVDLRVKASGGTRLHGTVAAPDGPVAGAMVMLIPEEGGWGKIAFGTSGEAGDYELENVEAGRYALQCVVLDDGFVAGNAPGSPVLDPIVIGGLPEQRHDVRLAGGTLHGTVSGARDGRRLAGVRVVLERVDDARPDAALFAASGNRVGEEFTDGAGNFRFRHLPTGDYELVAGGRNLMELGTPGWSVTRVGELRVVDGSPGFSVQVELQPAGGAAGTLRDPTGAPLSGVSAWAKGANGSWNGTLSEASSDAGGRWALHDLSPGGWTLAFGGAGRALTLVPGVLVREGETTRLDVTLRPGTRLLLDGNGRATGRLQLRLSGADGLLPTGLSSLDEILGGAALGGRRVVGTYAPGPYHLEVISEGGDPIHAQDLVLGADGRDVVVTLPEP